VVELPDLNFKEGISDFFLTLDNSSDFFQAVCWNGIPKHKCSSECPFFIKHVSIYNRSTSKMLMCKRDPERVKAVRAVWRRKNSVGGANSVVSSSKPNRTVLEHTTVPSTSVAVVNNTAAAVA